MVVRVGINGFGRIGRVIFRTCHENPDLEIAAINDPAIDVEYICYLIKFDSTHGKFKGNITHIDNEITVDENKIKVFHEKLPVNVPWQLADVQYVVEASGIFTSLQKASGHLAGEGIKRVIVTAPSVDVPMVILGVNHTDLQTDKRIISSASSTLYCLAPIVKILNDNFGVSEGFITSIHAMTPSLKPLDGLCLRGKHWRDHRSIHQNIIPATTGACKALGKIIPQVKDRLAGLAFRVPIVNVSVLDLTMRLNKETSMLEIAKAVDALSKSSMRNIIKISKEEAVSSDFAGDQHSCILDVDSSLQLKKNFFKLVCWYENEYSYACRVIDLILFSEKQFQLPDPRSKMTFIRTKGPKKYVQKYDDQPDVIKLDNMCQCLQSQASSMLQRNSQIRIRLRSPTRPRSPAKPTSPVRSAILRKLPGNAIERNETKSNEIFRIWNDENEVNKRAVQNRSAIYHSDVAITSPSQIGSLRAQQRLENVKKEFSKMVSITESLLRKCSKIRDMSCPSTFLEDKINATQTSDNIDIIKSHGDKISEITSPLKHKKHISDISGDCIPTLVNISKSKTNFSKDQLSSYNESSLDFSISSYQIGSVSTVNPPIVCNNDNLAPQPNDDIQNPNAVNNIVDKIVEDHVVETVTSLIDGLTDSVHTNGDEKQEGDSSFPDEYKDIDRLAYPRENDCDSGFMSPVKRNRSQTGIFCDENTIAIKLQDTDITMEEKPQVNAYYMEIKNSEIVQYKSHNPEIKNLVAAGGDQPETSDNSQDENCRLRLKTFGEECLAVALPGDQTHEKDCTQSTTFNTECLDVPIDSPPSQKLEIPPEILNSLNIITTDPVLIVSDNSKRPSSTLTVSGYSETGRKMDIYDKLDSVSASDSDSSFQIHERKSQVINITDLSNSIEDIARLDKICRIIEISDELSDQLFSSLGNPECAAIKNAKWSFKDLCQRIKLDEFCNKLFSSQNQ